MVSFVNITIIIALTINNYFMAYKILVVHFYRISSVFH